MRKKCHVCGSFTALTKSGKLYKHQRHMGSSVQGKRMPFKAETCPASGMTWMPFPRLLDSD